MSRWRAWYQEYRGSLKPLELEELPDLLFCRPPAFLLAKLLRGTRVTPDGVSLFAAIWSLVVAALYWQGDHRSAVLGGAAYFFWNVLDCADGQLARMKGGGSPIGYVVDEVVDQISTFALWVGLTHCLVVARAGEHNWWVVGAAAALAMGIECGVLEGQRHEWMARVYGSRKSLVDDLNRLAALAEQWRNERSHPVGRFVIRFHQVQRWLQRIYLPGGVRAEPTYSAAENARWTRHHRKALAMAVWLGPTMHMCVQLACTLAGRVDAYLWAVLFVGVPWMLLVHAVTWYAKVQEHREPLQES
jgi:phosphatidylglycerophosphate synthase